jgi:SAM-dependent methyltransferase
MSERPWYKDWFSSPFYHKLYFERDETEAEGFILRLIDHLKPAHGSFMLDVACGRGRHSRTLAQKGFFVTGIDISFESIAFAKKSIPRDSQGESSHLEFYQHDMRLPFRVNYFHYAFNFFTSFGYFRTRREHDDAIRTIAKGLKPNGLFVIDYLNVHFAEEKMVSNEMKKINGTTYRIHRWHDEGHFYKKITIDDPQILQPVSFTEKVSKFSFGDFNDMLSFQGLQVQEVFGDYQLGSYDVRTKPRMIIVAKKNSKAKSR